MRTDIVIPTLNAGRTLQSCLASIVEQSEQTHVIVVDGGSRDDTIAIATDFQVQLVHSERKGFSVKRNLGAKHSAADIVAFIDADMVLGSTVISEASEILARDEFVGVVVPEISFGTTYWANVRSFERSFHSTEQSPEAARIFLKNVFDRVGGYDERLSAMEDFALDRAARKVGEIARTNATILHDEGDLHYFQACKKKANYATGILTYSQIYGRSELANFLLHRDYFRTPYRLLRRPLLGVGVAALKFGETVAVLSRLFRQRLFERTGGAGKPF